MTKIKRERTKRNSYFNDQREDIIFIKNVYLPPGLHRCAPCFKALDNRLCLPLVTSSYLDASSVRGVVSRALLSSSLASPESKSHSTSLEYRLPLAKSSSLPSPHYESEFKITPPSNNRFQRFLVTLDES